MPKPSNSNPWFLSAAVALMAIALIAAPLDFTPPDWQFSISAAEAKGGGGGGGGGGGKGGGNDKDNDKDKSSAKSGGKDNGKSASAKGGKGGKGGSKAKDKAQKRYAKALGLGVDGVKPGKSIHTFSHKQVKGLLGHKWKAGKFDDPNFKNHGQRVSTFVKIAKALGYGAWVGAMQANFGTLQELEAAVADAEAALAALPVDDPAIPQAEADLAEADARLADPKPGNGPKGEWTTVDLDVNADGVVDTLDLDAALALP